MTASPASTWGTGPHAVSAKSNPLKIFGGGLGLVLALLGTYCLTYHAVVLLASLPPVPELDLSLSPMGSAAIALAGIFLISGSYVGRLAAILSSIVFLARFAAVLVGIRIAGYGGPVSKLAAAMGGLAGCGLLMAAYPLVPGSRLLRTCISAVLVVSCGLVCLHILPAWLSGQRFTSRGAACFVLLGLGLGVARPLATLPNPLLRAGIAVFFVLACGLSAAWIADQAGTALQLDPVLSLGFALLAGFLMGSPYILFVSRMLLQAERGRVADTQHIAAQQALVSSSDGFAHAGAWEWDVSADQFRFSPSLAAKLGLEHKEVLSRSELHSQATWAQAFPSAASTLQTWTSWQARSLVPGSPRVRGRGRLCTMDGRQVVLGIAVEDVRDATPLHPLPGDDLAQLSQEISFADISAPQERLSLDTVLGRAVGDNMHRALAGGVDMRHVRSGLSAVAEPVILARLVNLMLSAVLGMSGTERILVGVLRRGSKVHLCVARASRRQADVHLSAATSPDMILGRRIAGILGLETTCRSGKDGYEAFELVLDQADLQEHHPGGVMPSPYLVALHAPEDGERRRFRQVLTSWGHKVAEHHAPDGFPRSTDVPDVAVIDCRSSSWATGLAVVADFRRECGWDIPAVLLSSGSVRTMEAVEGLAILIAPFGDEALRLAIQSSVAATPWNS